MNPPLWRRPDFGPYLAAALVSNLGSWMQLFTEQWVVLGLAGPEAARWGGRLGFASGLAILVFTPFGGTLADRCDRRKVLALTQAWLLCLALALGFLALRPGGLTLRWLMVFALGSGLGTALSLPMSQGLIGDLVPAEEVSTAMGLHSVQFNLCRILGPTLAALLLPWVGISGNFFLNALSFLPFIWVALRLRPRHAPPKAEAPGSYREGFRAYGDQPALRSILGLAVVAGLFAWPYFQLLPVYGTQFLGAGERGVAVLLSCFGLGAVAGSLGVARGAGRRGVGRPGMGIVLAAYGGFGLGLMLLGGVPRYPVAALALFAMGFVQATFLTLMASQIQWLAPPALRGRVSAIYLTAILGLLPFGNLLAGELAQRLGSQGPRWVLVLDGLVMLGAAAFQARSWPKPPVPA